MNVYLVPIGPDGYELYCEPHDAPAHDGERLAGWRQKASERFRSVLVWLELDRAHRVARRAAWPRPPWFQRARDRVVAWLAERVAEQRLLWHLRRHASATAHYPDDVSAAAAADIVQRSLRRDATRHLRWMLVNVAGYFIVLPLSVFPGPNVPLFYFVFRAAGHYLSWIGARHGQNAVAWSFAPCAPLTDLRRLPSLPRDERAAFAHAVAERLALEHLDTFAERMALACP
jgi:hypothetical protein